MKQTLWILVCVVLAACNSGKKIDQAKIAQEMRNREVVHITPVQLTEQTWTDGKRLAAFLDSTLLARLQKQIATEGDITKVAPVCHTTSLPIDSLEKMYPVRIQRLAFTSTDAARHMAGKEYEVWDAYKYQFEQNLDMTANVQTEGNDMLYTQPIVLSHTTCLKCHGTPTKDLTQNDFRQLRQQQPRIDSLQPYALGQPIGLWSFRFSKAALVRHITVSGR